MATDIIELDASDPAPLKEVIAQRISLLSGNVRYVYIGSRPLDDFRYVKIAEEQPITMADTDAVEKIL